MRRSLRLLAVATAAATAGTAGTLVLTSSAASADAFAPLDLVVYRVGDGLTSLANTAAPVFLDTYASDTSSGLPKATVTVPTTTVGAQRHLTATGLSRSEGQLSLSPDGALVAFTGYDASPGATGPDTTYTDVNGVDVTVTQSLTASDPAGVARVVGLLDGTGATDTSTAVTGAGVPHVVRAATTADGLRVWLGGSDGGVLTAQRGATTATSVLSTAGFDADALQVAGGRLYAGGANDASSSNRLGTVGSDLPTAAADVTGLTGLPTGLLPGGFLALDLSPTAPGVDTLYAVNGAERGGGVDKYSTADGSTWSKQGFVALPGALAVTGKATGTQVTLAATTPDGLWAFGEADGTAAGFSAAPSRIATAPAGTEFRGVAPAPTGDALSRPTVTITTPQADTHVPANATTLAASGTASALRGIASVTAAVDGGTPVTATVTGDTWSVGVDLPAGLATGAHTLSVTATDSGSTPASATSTVSFTKDAPPAAAFTAPGAGQHVSYLTSSLTVSGTASAARGVSGVTLQVDNGGQAAATLSGASWSRAVAVGSLAVGTHTLTVRATETTSGAVTTVTRTFVRDGVPAGAIGPGTASFLNSRVSRSAGWSALSYGGSPDRRGIRTAGTSSVRFSAYGREVDLHFQRRPDAGRVRVTIDGRSYVVDLYSGGVADLVKPFRGLTPARHTVTITALHQRSTASRGYLVTLGYLRVVA